MKNTYSFLPKSWLRVGLFTALAASSLSVQAQTVPAKLWDKTIGGSDSDNLSLLKQTSDGGYILAANSSSGISGDKTQASKGLSDYWVVKIDSSGNKSASARATVLLNGVKIYDNQELNPPRGAASRLGEAATGPLMLQEHGMPLQFRNIWLTETKPAD